MQTLIFASKWEVTGEKCQQRNKMAWIKLITGSLLLGKSHLVSLIFFLHPHSGRSYRTENLVWDNSREEVGLHTEGESGLYWQMTILTITKLVSCLSWAEVFSLVQSFDLSTCYPSSQLVKYQISDKVAFFKWVTWSKGYQKTWEITTKLTHTFL